MGSLLQSEPDELGYKYVKSRPIGKFLERVEVPKQVTFNFYRFSLTKFISIQRKMVLMINEVSLLGLVGSVVKGLLLCYSARLPHGNLTLDTVFKANKFDWKISPPTFSRNNLKLRVRRIQEFEQKKLAEFKEEEVGLKQRFRKDFKQNHLKYLLPFEKAAPQVEGRH